MRFLLIAQLLVSFVFASASEAIRPPGFQAVVLTSRDGTKINAEAAGNKNGPHIIFGHGLACTLSAFDPLFSDAVMLKTLYMVRFDTRGHGLSGKPATADFYTSDRYADDLKALITAFKLVKPFYAGWSLGGAIAADITANFPHPLPFSGLIWISGLPYIGDILPKVATPEVLGLLPGLQSTNDSSLALTTRIAFVETLSAHTETVPPAIKNAWVGSAGYLPPAIATRVLGRTQDPTRLIEEGKAGWPLLIVHGAVDRQINGSAVIENMKPVFTNFEAYIVQGTGHIPFYDDEPTISRRILAFVARVVATKPYPKKNH